MEHTAPIEQEEKITTVKLFRNMAYVKLLIAGVISRIGDSIDMIAYSWMVYQMTGSELILGTIFMVNALPSIIISPFAGVLVDHFSKKKVIIIGDIGRGLIVGLTALLFLMNALEVYHLFIFTMINSTFEAFANPAKGSVFSLILKDNEYLKGNSLFQSAASLAGIIGYGVAGFLIAIIGISGAIFIDGATFLISCIIILFIRFNDQKSDTKLNVKSYINNLKEGFKFVMGKSVILISIILMASLNLFLSPISALMPVYVDEALVIGDALDNSNAIALSFISVGLSVGTVVGGIVVSAINNKMKKSSMTILGNVLFGVFITLTSLPAFGIITFIKPLYFSTFIFFMIGFTMVFLTAPLRTYLMQNTPKEIMGRVFALLSMVTLSTLPIGGALSGVIATFIPLSILYLSCGLMVILMTIIPLSNKKFRNE